MGGDLSAFYLIFPRTRRFESASALLYETQASSENLISSCFSGSGTFEMVGIYLRRAKECCNSYCSFMLLVTCLHDCLELSVG